LAPSAFFGKLYDTVFRAAEGRSRLTNRQRRC
jgi:hypothetical protein